jgi:sugar O-acyltransferase (sialic acid O-acetyltransferase NeuD family)
MKKLAIIGASGHGKVIADIAVKNEYKEIVFLDDNPKVQECAGFRVVGTLEDIDKYPDYDVIVAIGNASIRKKIHKKVGEDRLTTLIHPQSVISRRVTIGKGTVVMAGAIVNSDTKIGEGCIINTGASVDHDCSIGDFVHVSVGAHVAGTVTVGNGTWVGAGATVSNNIEICEVCMIGAGALVIKNIKENGTYIGVPVKKMKNEHIFGGGITLRLYNVSIPNVKIA